MDPNDPNFPCTFILPNAIKILKNTIPSCDRDFIKTNVELVIDGLKRMYEGLKTLYYSNLLCKTRYCIIRENREKAIELLTCASKVLDDTGGLVPGYCYDDAHSYIADAIHHIKIVEKTLCRYSPCSSSCSDSCSSSCSSCSSSCSSSSC